MLQNASPLRKSAPWPPNISHEHVFCTAPATENASLQILDPHVLLTFDKVHNPLRLLYILTSKCASRCCATTACTFSTSQLPKVARQCPTRVCFVHFDFEMCFAPQRRALFRHLNFQKWSGPGVFCAFWLRNVLRATAACTFSSLIWPDGSAPAALASLLFDPPRSHKSLEKHSVSRFSRICIFFLLTLSLLSSSLFCSSLLPASALLCFSSVHIVGSLTSKLPSTKIN